MRRLVALCLLGLSWAIGLSGDGSCPAATGPTPAETFSLGPQRPGKTDVYILSFGLWGPQSVFESEARGAARILESTFESKGSPSSAPTPNGSAGATGLDPDGRIPGSRQGPRSGGGCGALRADVAWGAAGLGLVTPREAGVLTPRDVGTLLDATGAKYRVLIVSACYSGVFADALGEPAPSSSRRRPPIARPSAAAMERLGRISAMPSSTSRCARNVASTRHSSRPVPW